MNQSINTLQTHKTPHAREGRPIIFDNRYRKQVQKEDRTLFYFYAVSIETRNFVVKKVFFIRAGLTRRLLFHHFTGSIHQMKVFSP